MPEENALRVVITGGSGFIGTNLVEHFIARRQGLLNLDIAKPRNQSHERYWKPCDIRNAEHLRDVVHKFSPDVVIHMGARTDLDSTSLSDYSANTVGVTNLIAAVQDLPSLQRIIFASSRLVCRIGYQPKSDQDYCPTTAYGASKVIGEKLVRAATEHIPCPWLIVRPTSIWGPWFDIPYKTFFLSVSRGLYVHPGRKTIRKSFGFIGNTLHELDLLLQAPAQSISGKTIYLADYPPIDVAIMADTIQKTIGCPRIRRVNTRLLRLGAWTGDLLQMLGWSNPHLTSFRLDNLLTEMIHDLEPLRVIVGPLPYSMEDGIRITVDWLREHGEISC